MSESETSERITQLLFKLGVSDTPLNRAIVFRAFVKEFAEGYTKGREYGELIGAGKL